MANLLQRFLNVFQSQNRFNEAIFSSVGGAYTQYDTTNQVLMEKGYGENPDVFALVNQMSKKTQAVPFEIKQIKDKKANEKIRQLMQSTKGDLSSKQIIQKMLLEKKAYKEDEVYLEMPFERPNPNQSWTDILALYKTFIKVTGNCYFYILAPEEGMNAGQPMQLYVLPADKVQIVLKQNAKMLTVENPIDYYLLINGSGYIEFPQSSIIHVKYANPFYNLNGNHLYGLSELKAAIRNIQSSNLAIDNNNKVMANSGVFGFIHGKAGATPLTDTQANSLKERLIQMDRDPSRLANIAGASGEIAFTRISLTTDELKPFDYLSFDRKVLCNVLNWPDELLNNDSASGVGGTDQMIEARKRAITDNIYPDLLLLADSLNTEFFPRFKNQYKNAMIEFDVSELPEMQSDMKQLVEWLSRSPITPNEFREALKYESLELDGMDNIWVEMNKVKIDEQSVPNDDFTKAFNLDV